MRIAASADEQGRVEPWSQKGNSKIGVAGKTKKVDIPAGKGRRPEKDQSR